MLALETYVNLLSTNNFSVTLICTEFKFHFIGPYSGIVNDISCFLLTLGFKNIFP